MDKYLTRPRNPSAKHNSSDTTTQDCDNHENYDCQKDIQCAVGKDIRSFFAKPTISKYDNKNESLKTERTSASDVKQLFKKSKEIDLDRIKEKNDRKRQFPDSSDEEEANRPILKIKINWSKRQKLQPEVKNIEGLPPTRLVEERDDASEAAAEATPSDATRVLGDPEPTNREVSTSNEPKEVHGVRSESRRAEVDKNDEEVQGADVEAGNNSLRRSSRRCSVPARLGSMVMLENEVKSPRGKKESQLKTAKKSSKVSNQQPPDDKDDVIVVGVVNNNNNGKALAPMFRKHPKMSVEEKERRKNFLMSGVPEEIRRQQAALQNQASSASRYAPFPRFNHVTQMSVDDDENESPNSQIPLPYLTVDHKIQTPVSFFPKNLFSHLWSESETEKPRLRENFVSASPAFGRSSDVLEQLLLEIKTSNSEFPVKSIYEMLTTKQKYRTILPRNPTEVIISDDDDDDDEGDDKEERIEDDRSTNENIMSKFHTEERNLLWTEKYAPARANEIVGNKAECKKVYDWLLDLKAKYSHSSDDKGYDSMDDFWTPDGVKDGGLNPSTFTSNALLVVGPHGIGKTALVYAVARELGFKVFEVNPSSAREGKQVWSQLQEATQSHQLHTSRCSTNEEVSIRGRKEEIMKTQTNEKPKSKSPRGKLIPSLFGSKVHPKTSNVAKKKQKIIMETKKKNKAPLKKNKFGRKNNEKKGIKSGYSTAAKTSLILFDEADVVFESDRGFWSAVQKFVKTTKRPIVLTVSDENFVQKFGMDIEVVNMKRPDNAFVSSYLRTMALAEGLRLDGLNVEALVESFNCDVRRCILQFQMMFSNKIPQYLSSLRPICYSKSSLEPSLDELKDWQGNTASQSNAVNGCTMLPSEPRTSKGENSKPEDVGSPKPALRQSSMTAYFNLGKAACADDDDDDFVLSPVTKRSRKMNRIESEDDLEQKHIKTKEDHGNDSRMEQHCIKAKEDHDNDGRVTEGKKEDEFVTFDCEVPVFRMPRAFCGCSDVGPLRTPRPPFYQNFFATSFQNYDDFSSNVLLKRSDGRDASESCSETDEEENMRSLKLLSKVFDQVSLNEVTFRNRLEPLMSEATYDLQFRKISKPLPGESDQFGIDEKREAKLSFCRSGEEIRNAIFDMTSRTFSEQIFKNGNDLEQLLARQDEDLMECQRRLIGVFQDRQSLMSDLRKSSLKNHTRWNPMLEILPMLVKMSEAENQRRLNKSRRRFLHYLSYVYPNIHLDKFNLRM